MKKMIFLSIITILLSSYAMAEYESTEGESITFPDGSRYVGEFKDGKRHGQGTYTWSDWDEYGDKNENEYKYNEYIGQWENDKKNGEGTMTWGDGSKYVGQWKDDKIHGQGTMTWPKKWLNEYTGSWESNGSYAHGKSGMDEYVGQWKDGKRNGQGTMTWADGSKYAGQWKDDLLHGLGTFTNFQLRKDEDGYRYEYEYEYEYVGQLKDGKFNGEGTKTWSNGNKYVGQWKDDKKHGQGTYTYYKNEYVGQWKDDEKHGDGTLTRWDESKYVGQWKNDKMHGHGTMYTSGGTIYQQGIFEDDKFIKASNEKPVEATKDKLGKLIGTIGGFEGNNVIVNGKDSTISSQAPMGQALIVDANGQYIYLESTFPMQTVVKCKVTNGDRAKIKKGMKVYLKP